MTSCREALQSISTRTAFISRYQAADIFLMSDTQRHEGGLPGLPKAIRVSVLAAQNKKASDVVVLDLRTAFAFTDFFVICSGLHPRQVKSIAESIEGQLRQNGSKPAVIEGTERSEWILLDFFDFVVHVFTPDVREFYGLEQLWGDAERLEVDDSEMAE